MYLLALVNLAALDKPDKVIMVNNNAARRAKPNKPITATLKVKKIFIKRI